VLAVGKGTKDHEMTVKVGDEVLYGKYSGTEVEIDGTKYMIMKEGDIYAII
jgi:chaperonin GroES